MKKLDIGIIMDPISQIKYYKDSSFAMMLEAQNRGYTIYYMEIQDLFMKSEIPMARVRKVKVYDKPDIWYQFTSEESLIELSSLDVVLMRKDPPFDMQYIYATYILEFAEKLVNHPIIVNKPQSLRDANEKMFTLNFPECIVPTVVSRDFSDFQAFIEQHQDVIIKPLDGMGGRSIFRIQQGDPNTNVILESVTNNQQSFVMMQRFIPEITEGDKRILLIDGDPIDYALARIPSVGENRGNLASGGQGQGIALNERDYWICDQIKPTLKAKGLIFVGLDVIGDYITEINVTSPTCIRELDSQFNLNISATMFDKLEKYCHEK
ncbi:MAG: glutathione synthase [Gammaproteobacteria bacterium]|nr:glutathione synthase [Gammaproteobacteria bacterium]